MLTFARRPIVTAGVLVLALGTAAACSSSSSGGKASVHASTSASTGGPLKVSPFQTQDQANLAINSGRADVGMADSPVAAYIVQQSHGAFKLTGQAYGTAPYGIAMSKHSGTLDQAILAAIKDLMADGQYYSILQKWNITQGGISNPQINGASQTIQPATKPSTTTAPTVDAAAVKLLPASLKAAGTLKVAADASYAPDEFLAKNGKTVIGMDADLAQAIGKVLGLKVTVSNVSFDAIIPAIQNGRYDLGMSSFTDNTDREKQVNFVTYFSAGTSFYVKANGGPNIQTLADLCGHTVAVEAGTTEEADAKAQAKKC
jgi:ABC-type amino acid transport substrate-binding protein